MRYMTPDDICINMINSTRVRLYVAYIAGITLCRLVQNTTPFCAVVTDPRSTTFLTARLAALEVADRALLNQCYHPPIVVGRMI